VNIGDMMAQWTNDKWVSTLHRVVAPGASLEELSRRRRAIAFFLTSNYDVVLTPLATCCSPANPPKYAPVTAGEYFFARVSRQFSREGDVTDDIRERVRQ
jgi:isopenicillin N synthase-like dioxygenase